MTPPMNEGINSPPSGRHLLKRLNRWLGYSFFTMFLVFLTLQIWSVRQAIRASGDLGESHIAYSELIPDKPEYVAGDLASFTFTRKTTEPSGYPILLLICDGFEHQGTHEVFPGILAPRIIKQEGTEEIHAIRRIPEWAPTGTYIFQGWSSSQTGRPNRANYYASGPFLIKARPTPVTETRPF